MRYHHTKHEQVVAKYMQTYDTERTDAKPERPPDKGDLLRKLDEKFLNGDLSPGEYQELKNRLMETAQSRGEKFDIAYG